MITSKEVWQVKWVDTSRATTNLKALFNEGWEPFAVDGRYLYLRRLVKRNNDS